MVDVPTARRHGVCPECEGYQDGPCDDPDCQGCELDLCPGCGGTGDFASWQTSDEAPGGEAGTGGAA
jgi:hypothetical protein